VVLAGNPNGNDATGPAAQASSIHVKTPKINLQDDASAKKGVKRKSGGSSFRMYLEGVGSKQQGLETALRAAHINDGVYGFVKRMIFAAISVSVVVALVTFLLFNKLGLTIELNVILTGVIFIAIFRMAFSAFLKFPTRKINITGKGIERDVLFAARDMIISLRSGLPLFNAITYVSTGYGDASSEFKKIIERVQVGTSLVDAIDEVIAQTKSASFRRLMLQASVSIKSGADVIGALQSIIDQLTQERIIAIRSYGQKLNAIAMFYMLFGIILPTMGIAVLTILTTFIALFTVNVTVLAFAVVMTLFLQIIFLKMIQGSRPVFAM
jgi:archaeal flagellar protein FlaJ